MVIGVLALVVGCTKSNPAATCTNGSCRDPAYPFCDADGAIAGIPGTCIAVQCTAGQFGACRADDVSLVCSSSGDNYNAVQCANGCDPSSGCLACAPNQTVCTNGMVASCDAMGVQTLTPCPLGCFEDQSRCRDIDPSNRLATYMDMVQSPVDLDAGARGIGL